MNRRKFLGAAAAAIAAVGVGLGLCRRPAPVMQDWNDYARLRTGSFDTPEWKEAEQLPPRSPGWVVTPVRPRGK